jgi:hypothetical protein
MDDIFKYNPKMKRDTRDPSQRVYIKPKKRVPKSKPRTYLESMNRKRKDTASSQTITKPSRSMMVDTTTYPLGQDPKFRKRAKPTTQKRERSLPPKEDNIGQFSKGGYCRGAGAAIKGTKFEGVF